MTVILYKDMSWKVYGDAGCKCMVMGDHYKEKKDSEGTSAAF